MLLRFGIISAVLTGVLGVALTSWLTNFIKTTNINHARDTATYTVGLSLNSIDWQADRQATAAQLAQTTTLLRGSLKTGKYVGATAWLPGDVVAYAMDPARIGKREAARPQVKAALQGTQSAIVVSHPAADAKDPAERAALAKSGPLLETFTPARLGSRVVAAVALYQPWRPVQRLVTRETREMQLLVAAGLVVLWVGLLHLVLTASRRLREQAATNWRLASHDALTGLPNRKLLQERVERALRLSTRSGRHVAVLLFDLNGFKEVNDTLGHHAGDELLRQIGPRLQRVLREGDLLARLGGDEFVVVLPAIDTDQEAAATARRLTTALADPFVVDGVSLDVEASIGIAVSPTHGTDCETLLRHADAGMYTAKQQGGGVAMQPELDADRGGEKIAMLGPLRRAANDPSQLLIDYQPVVSLVTGEVLELEALVRWRHPQNGLLLAAAFVPLAERTGLIHGLTRIVLDQVLVQAAAWRSAGWTLPISVNVGVRCLLDARFCETVRGLMTDNGSAHDALILEVPEGALAADPDRARESLGRLQALGVGLTLDNFGVGYSALRQLSELPLSQLKMDRSFVTALGRATESEDEASSAALGTVRSCIAVAHHLGMRAIAAGVETQPIRETLASAGCDAVQGFLISLPLPAQEVTHWLADHAPRPATAGARQS